MMALFRSFASRPLQPGFSVPLALAAIVGLFPSACGSTRSSDAGCTPGEQKACSCGGSDGSQICDENGTGFAACDCGQGGGSTGGGAGAPDGGHAGGETDAALGPDVGGSGAGGSDAGGPCSCAPPNATGRCVDGSCAVDSCEAGFLDCDGLTANGCETASDTIVNCGACGSVCSNAPNGSAACASGSCSLVCNSGYLECDGDLVNGCEPSTVVFDDADGDGFGEDGTMRETCVPVLGEAMVGGDCDDTDPLVFPGQNQFFGMANPNVGFDYNCNGSEDHQWGVGTGCVDPPGSTLCSWSTGSWMNPVSCGTTGTYLIDCVSCSPVTGTRLALCR